MPSLLDRLKERKIVQWSIAYLAASYGLLEVFDLLSDPFGDADAIKRALVTLFAFGFLITLVLAWFHAEKGKQRVTAVELVILAVLVVGSIPTAIVSYRLDGGSALAMDAGIESVLSGPVVAVLPFDNASAGEEGAKFIVDGIHAEILTNLSTLAGLNAISRTSVLGYERAGKTVRQIAEDLGASAILDGQIQKVGDAIRITVSLIDGRTDVPIWSDVFNHVMDPQSVFAIQAEIAGAIAEALAITLAPAEQSRLTRVPTRDREALELYMAGQEAEDRGDRGEREFYKDAAGYYQQALERDPEYADAQAAHGRMISAVYWRVPGTERTPEKVDSIRMAAERAIELDPELAAGHLLLGEYYIRLTTNVAGASLSFQRARDLDPDNVPALTGLASLNMHAGDYEAARANLYRAAQLDPREGQSQRLAGSVAFYMRRFEDAEKHFARAIRRFAPGFETGQIDPEFYQPARIVTMVQVNLYLAMDGTPDRAIAALRRVIDQTEMTSANIAAMLTDAMQFLPVAFGPTVLSVDEFREELLQDPEFPPLFVPPTRATLLQSMGGDPEEVRRLWALAGDRQARRTFNEPGSYLEVLSYVGLAYARGGRPEDAMDAMNRAREISESYAFAELTLNAEPRWAMTLMELGEHEQALDLLEDMMSRPSAISVGVLNVQPEWDPIREHPRFQALLGGR